MKTLHADLEALMPEPVHIIHTRDETCEITLFTADQVREAMQAATERAAKVVEFGPPPRKLEGGRVEIGQGARRAFAAAIRAASMREGEGKTP